MPIKKTIERARKDKREGKAASTQAGEFVREEIELIRKGAHGARSAKQAIAIGLSKARRAGVKLPAKERDGLRRDTREGEARSGESGARSREAFAQTIASHAQSPETRAARNSVESSAREAGPHRRSQAHPGATLGRGEESRAHSRGEEVGPTPRPRGSRRLPSRSPRSASARRTGLRLRPRLRG
jgi:hypothetical protein